VGYPVEKLLTCVIGEKLGVGIADPQGIRVKGDHPAGMPLTDFKAPKSMSVAWNLSKGNLLRRFAENHIVTRPQIDPAECQLCGICLAHCPPQAISEVQGAMQIDRDKCILCFCCHELCTNNAVRMVKPMVGRLLASFTR
jgi:Pyruvate/2-oxoacid:ferredoxin oxidoreductase delta subunit